jgi:UDP-N-acetylmuramate--alanine ligase
LIKALAKAKESDRLLDVDSTKFAKDVNDLPNLVMSMARDGDVVITMGAGSISAVPGKLTGASHA